MLGAGIFESASDPPCRTLVEMTVPRLDRDMSQPLVALENRTHPEKWNEICDRMVFAGEGDGPEDEDWDWDN